MKNKLLLFLTVTIFSYTHTIEQPTIDDFDTIQDTEKGIKSLEIIRGLSQDEKNENLRGVYNLGVPHNAPYNDEQYPQKRPLIKMLILGGADVNSNLGTGEVRKTILEKAVSQQDVKATKFLLDHGARATDTDYERGPLLALAEKEYIAKLLVDHEALRPYRQNKELQLELLSRIFMWPEFDISLIPFYKKAFKEKYDIDLDFTANNYKLQSRLLLTCPRFTSLGFFERFKTLLNEKAVNLSARNHDNQ